MYSINLIFIIVAVSLAAVSVEGQNKRLRLVKAGHVTGGMSEEIADLVQGDWAAATSICPEDYPEGFSVECLGEQVNANVKFFMNGDRVQTESRAPFHAAGDKDFGGLTFIEMFDDYLTRPVRGDGTRRANIKCQYRNNAGQLKSFSRKLIIEAAGCMAPPTVASAEVCTIANANGRVVVLVLSDGTRIPYTKRSATVAADMETCINQPFMISLLDVALAQFQGGSCGQFQCINGGTGCECEQDGPFCGSGSTPYKTACQGALPF